MIHILPILATLVVAEASLVWIAHHGNSLAIPPRTTPDALPNPGTSWHELCQIMGNDHPERNKMDKRQLSNAQSAAVRTAAIAHGTMFQGIAERQLGEVSHELNTARTLDELEKQFSKLHD